MEEMILGMGGALSGGVAGLIGTAFGRVAGYFERKQIHKFELKKMEHVERQNTHAKELRQMDFDHETSLHKLNMEASRARTLDDIAIRDSDGSWDGLKASIDADAATGEASLWVINLLRLVRPVLTLSLWIITGWIYKQNPDPSIVEAATFAATASTLWWFGDRYKNPLKTSRRAPNMAGF